MFRPTLWGTTRPTGRLNPISTSPSKNEIDLREHVDLLLFGDEDHPAHGHLVVIRRLRRDSTGAPTKCTCMADKLVREPDPSCSYCAGEGSLWDEEWIMCYSQFGGADSGLLRRQQWLNAGAIRVDYKIFFFRYDCNLKYGDKIIEIKLDEEGNALIPYVRDAIYKPQTINQLRSDNGRIEYYAVYCKEEDAIRTDTGA